MRECKHYGIRSSRRPKKHPLLSGVVHVADEEGIGLSYITFSETFVDAVGREMPQGLTTSRPAYLKVMAMPGRKTWRVVALYLHDTVGRVLWETDTKPVWVSTVYRG